MLLFDSMELSIIRISLCLVIFLSPLGCECGIQRNPLNDKLEKDILDLHGYILGIRTEIYQDRRNRDEILLRMNETIFRCYGKCGTNENKQEYDFDSSTTIKTSIHSLQRGLREEKRMNAIMKSKIEDLQEENNKLNQALKIMNEEKTENMNLMTETLKQINENVNKALQGAMDEKNKMMELLADIQNLKQENKDLNLAVKDLNDKQKAESYQQLDIMSRIQTIKDENQNLDQASGEKKDAISFNYNPVMENGKPWQQNETLNQEMTGVEKVPDVIKTNMTDKCALPSITGTIYSDSFSSVQVFPGLISSSTQIRVTCERGYFQILGRSHASSCLTGVWEPEILPCEKIVLCAAPNISNVIFHPVKKSYEVNETVSLTGCLNGLYLAGAKSLSCRKDGSWYGDAQCTSYCENGRISWETTFNKRVNSTVLQRISYERHLTQSGCFKSCENVRDCRAVYMSTSLSRRVRCSLYAENVRSKPEAFSSNGTPNYAVYNKLCNDECVTPMDLNETSLYNGDILYSDEIVPDGEVLSIKCKLPGITPVLDQVTCMGGKWNHPADAVSCLH